MSNDHLEEQDTALITGFLFGNIDIHGQLEDDDVLDEDSKRHLSALCSLGGSDDFKHMLDEIKVDSGATPVPDVDLNTFQAKSPTAIDFSDINEAIEEEGDVSTECSRYVSGSQRSDGGLLSVTISVPAPFSGEFRSPPPVAYVQQVKSEKHIVTPLADMLPPEFKGKDVREYFPDFRVGEVLRFSRLFPPQYPIVLYKRKKKAEEHETSAKRRPLTLDWGPVPPLEQCATDQQVTFLQPLEDKNQSSMESHGQADNADCDNSDNTCWRFGPAQYWYDRYGVDTDATSFDYGCLRVTAASEGESVTPSSTDDEAKVSSVVFPDDAYLMVSQKLWEDDVVWSGDDSRTQVMLSYRMKAPIAGWLPSPQCRTVEQYSLATKCGRVFTAGEKAQSFFPLENKDLVYSAWERHIVWDPDKLADLPEPQGLVLDPNDDNIVFEIPEDKESVSEEVDQQQPQSSSQRKEPRKSQVVLAKAGIIKEKEEDDGEEENPNQRKDPFNISNDEFYNPRLATDNALRTNLGGNLIQHSTPAMDLCQPFFPTFVSVSKLRQFHRPPLKRYSHGPMAMPGPHPVHSLEKQIKRKAKQREQERQAGGGGEIFFMRTPQDLTGCDGDLILAEYSEEYPPNMMQVGMATKIKNYYKRKPGKDNNPPELPYGELAYSYHSPFLGTLCPGQTIQAFENIMFRAPIYQHTLPETDFLIIRNRQHYYIRRVKDIFCVGQLCALMEVPGPNSKRANVFVRDFLQSFIYRLFWASNDNPRRIKMEDIKHAFQSHSESSIRKRLKLCADFKRTGMDSNWWVIKPDFRLPTHEEIRAMVSPEQCCSFYSLIAAEQRLKDAGYGEKSMFAPDQDEDDEAKIEDEVKTAPWNTTRAYIQALKGKCLLQLTGDADPTGCGEGFAYVRVPNKPVVKEPKEGQTPQKKTVTGTNADLRRLNLKDAKALLRAKGFPEAEIKKLSRWEVIDVVRTMSTQQAKAGEEDGMTKFARGNRFSVAEHQERYRDECQRIFDLQNRILSSAEVLSTDEGSDSSEDSDFEEMGKNIESMLSNKKSSNELSNEREEAELKQLQKSLMETSRGKDALGQDISEKIPSGNRKLIITRTFRDDEGHLYTRNEIVTKALVIEAYLKIRRSKSQEFIKQFASLDENQKEEMKRERRRIQEQLRRIKRNQEKLQKQPEPSNYTMSKKKKKENAKEIKLKCGACGQVGHMRTNKECPMYAGAKSCLPSVNVALTEEEEEKVERQLIPADENLIHVEGTKVKLSKQLIEHAEQVKRKTLTLKFPKQLPQKTEPQQSRTKRRRAGTVTHCDYLTKPHKVTHRRRADPLVSLCSVFETIISDLRDLPDTQPFHVPVNPKIVADYYKIIVKPMDLQTLKANVRERRYENREQFLADVHQMLENSKLYNGPKSVLTLTAQQMLDLTLRRFAEKEEKLMRLEKAINPLLDDNDQVAFSYILENIVENHLKLVDQIWPFLQPVNRKAIKDYYDIIGEPMDLQTILENVKKHKYHTRDEFLHDVELIYKNSVQYNGADNSFTRTAARLLQLAQQCCQENEEQLSEMERGIQAKQEAAMEGLESESIMTGTSFPDDFEEESNRGDYTIVEGSEIGFREGFDGDETQDSHPAIDETYAETFEDEEYVDIMDEDATQNTALEDDLQISENEEGDDQDEGSLPRGSPDAPDEDSQLSFDPNEFFRSAHFNMPIEEGGETVQEEGDDDNMATEEGHNITHDLEVSESEEEDDQPGGFDFDDFLGS